MSLRGRDDRASEAPKEKYQKTEGGERRRDRELRKNIFKGLNLRLYTLLNNLPIIFSKHLFICGL